MDLDDPALEHVVTIEFVQHLCLSGVYDITEIHVVEHLAFKGNLDRFRDRHRRFAGGQSHRYGSRIGTEGNAL